MSWKNPNGKCCLNCAFWQGKRKNSLGCWESDSVGDRGDCAQNVFCGVSSGPRAMDGNSCKKFTEIKAR